MEKPTIETFVVTINTFIGHIVHCRDLDGGTTFNIELMMNSKIPEDKLIDACYEAAKKNELVTLSGNGHEFEYLQPSGRVIEKKTTVEKRELAPIDPAVEPMLGIHHLE